MKTLIRFTSLLLLLCMTVMPVIYANDEASALPYTDNALVLLQEIGIMQLDDELESVVTRGKMCDVLLKLYGAESSKNLSYQSYSFNDIAENAYAASIQAATDLGVVSGFGDGTFRPDDAVKYEDAVTALVNVIGYGKLAQQNGGYPVGYLTVGNQVKLCNDVTGLVGEDITIEKLYNLIYKALHAEVLQQVGFGEQQQTYEAIEGQTLLYVNFDIKTVDGIVDGNQITNFTKKAKQPENIVYINGVSYYAGDLNIGDYLGYNVKAYYQENDNYDRELVTFTLNNRKNNVVTIKSEDISDESPKFSYNNFVASNGYKDVEYEISENVDVIYNGIAFPGFTLATLAPETGNVTLIDNNDDFIYDVIQVYEYTNYVVDRINTTEKIVFDMYGNSLSLSEDDYDIIRMTGMWGDEITIADLSKWNVLCAAVSNDGSVLTVKMFDDPVFGIISSIETDEYGDIIIVDGESFRISESYAAAVTAGHSNSRKLKVGDDGIFYLDADEKVAAVNLNVAQEWKYAYLIKATETENTMAESLYVKLLVQNTLEPAVFTTNERIVIDGDKKSGLAALTDLKTDDNGVVNAETIPQLIRFTTDGKGLIDKIDTTAQGQKETAENLSLYPTSGNRYSKWGGFCYTGNTVNFFVSTSTIIFTIPSSAANLGNDDLYKVRQKEYLQRYSGSSVDLDAYNVDIDGSATAKVLVVREGNTDASGASSSSLTFITSIQTTIDADGQDVIVIEGVNMSSGSKVKLKVEDLALANGLSKGDIIAFSDVDGLIYEIHNNGPVFDASAGATMTGQILFNDGSNANTANADHHVFFGIIYSANAEIMKTTMNIPATATAPVDPTGSAGIYSMPRMVYLCDMTRSDKKITQLTANEVQSYIYSMDPGYRFVMYTTTGVPYGMVIYKY